jgi:hypothetical protein
MLGNDNLDWMSADTNVCLLRTSRHGYSPISIGHHDGTDVRYLCAVAAGIGASGVRDLEQL